PLADVGGPQVDIAATGVGDVGQARLLVTNTSAQKPKVSPVTIWSRVSREAGVRLLWARSRTRTGSIVSGIRSPPGTGMRNQGMPRAVAVKWSRRQRAKAVRDNTATRATPLKAAAARRGPH